MTASSGSARSAGTRKPSSPRTRAAMAAARERKLKAHAAAVRRTYGITGAEYWALYEFQGGLCAICLRSRGASKRLSVDHDHSCRMGHDPKKGCPECVRGLLCGHCNPFLGWIRDDQSIGGRIGEYLSDPPYQRMRRMNAGNA